MKRTKRKERSDKQKRVWALAFSRFLVRGMLAHCGRLKMHCWRHLDKPAHYLLVFNQLNKVEEALNEIVDLLEELTLEDFR